MPLSTTAQRVQDLLKAHGFNCRVVEYAESTRTSQEAADRAGCTIGQITKSMIFKTTSNKPILVLTSGANRVDEARLKARQGAAAIAAGDAKFLADKAQVRVTGALHAVPNSLRADETICWLDVEKIERR